MKMVFSINPPRNFVPTLPPPEPVLRKNIKQITPNLALASFGNMMERIQHTGAPCSSCGSR